LVTISLVGIRSLKSGTFGLASGLLGEKMDDTFFKVIACVVTIVVLLFWLLISFKCIEHGIGGKIFFDSQQEEKRDGEMRETGDMDCSVDLPHLTYATGHPPSSDSSTPVDKEV
jgi:hypothetical protein